MFVFGTTALSEPGPHSRSFYTTHNDAPQSVELLWTSDQLVAQTSTWQHRQHSQQTNVHAPGGVRNHNFGRRAAADLHFRPRGHWDRQPEYARKWVLYWQKQHDSYNTQFTLHSPTFREQRMNWRTFIHTYLPPTVTFAINITQPVRRVRAVTWHHDLNSVISSYFDGKYDYLIDVQTFWRQSGCPS